jgi:hypothetical protein
MKGRTFPADIAGGNPPSHPHIVIFPRRKCGKEDMFTITKSRNATGKQHYNIDIDAGLTVGYG